MFFFILFNFIFCIFLILSFVNGSIYADVPYAKQYGFQDPATIYFENMINLHHDIVMFLIIIFIFVFYMLFSVLFNFNSSTFIHPPVDIRHNTLIEVIWTLVPTAILISIAIPSFALLYSLEEYHEPLIHIKAVGNQWYWTYECSDFYDFEADPLPIIAWEPYEVPMTEDMAEFLVMSPYWEQDEAFWFRNLADWDEGFPYPELMTTYLVNYQPLLWKYPENFYFKSGYFVDFYDKWELFEPILDRESDYMEFLVALDSKIWVNKPFRHSATMMSEVDVLASKGKALRLLSTDNILVLPSNVWVKLSVTANDVLHSWTIPSFGVKLDGCPGRLNSSLIYIKREGVFYGQCSEICGVQHGFMPIEVHVVDAGHFLNYAFRNL